MSKKPPILAEEIIPTEGALAVQEAQQEVTIELISSMNNIRNREIPKSAVRSHPGKGGKTFTYIDHVWVTKTLQDITAAVPWSWDVREATVESDGSATAIGTFTIYMMWNGQVLPLSITEVGQHEDLTGKMPIAARKASAASRCLVRCVFRRFGLGSQFYQQEAVDDVAVAWNNVVGYAKSHRMDLEKVKAMLKENGFANKEAVADDFPKVWQLLYDMSKPANTEEL